MSTLTQTRDNYWVALRLPGDPADYLFGPYTADGIAVECERWLRTYPATVWISEPFAAETYDLANRIARTLMPEWTADSSGRESPHPLR